MASKLESFSDDDLAQELKSRGLFENGGLAKWPVYQISTGVLPVMCVDVIPVRIIDDKFQIGVIERATGPEAGKLAVIGGRVHRNEKIKEAIAGHLKNDLEIVNWKFHRSNTEEKPFYVQQYMQGEVPEEKYGYDPDKHSIAITYLLDIEDVPKPKEEAGKFEWIFEAQIPKNTAYNHGVVMSAAFDFLNKN